MRSKPTLSGLLLSGIVLACGLAGSQRAEAAFIAYICDDALCTGGGDTIVTDQGAGDNFPGSASVGQINAGAISISGFSIVTNVAQNLGTAALPTLDITFSATSTDNLSHTLYLYASATAYTGPGGAFSLQLGGTQAPGSGGTSVTGRAWGGNSNSNLDMSNLLGSVTSSATPFAQSVSGSFVSGVSPYALTAGVQITRAFAGTTTGSLSFAVSPVPEPAAMLMAALGLVGVLAARRRHLGV